MTTNLGTTIAHSPSLIYPSRWIIAAISPRFAAAENVSPAGRPFARSSPPWWEFIGKPGNWRAVMTLRAGSLTPCR
jgi:hypothetical protein